MLLTPNGFPSLTPSVHLRNASGKAAPVCVLVGDSIATPEPGVTFDDSGSLYGTLRRQIAAQNPTSSPIVYNRSIGGTRWDHLSNNKFPNLNDLPMAIPTWPDDPSVDTSTDSWLDTITALSPDVIFFNFGMNDREIFSEVHFQDVLFDMESQLPNTDLVFITNMVPNYYSSSPNRGGDDAQNARLFVAERVRTEATYHGHGVIDVGREQVRKVAGCDPCLTSLGRVADAVSASTPYPIPQDCDRDFGIVATIPLEATTWDTRIKLTTSMQGDNSESWIEIYEDGGTVQVEFAVLDNTNGRYKTVDSGIPAATSGDLDLSIFLRGGWASVEIDGTLVFDGLIKRHGGTMRPVLSFLDGRSTAITVTAYAGTYQRVAPQMTFTEMFGSPAVSGDVEGGNDENHPTSLGWAAIFGEVFSATDLTMAKAYAPGGVVELGGVVPLMGDDSTYTIPTPFNSGKFILLCGNLGNGQAVVGAELQYYSGADATVQFSQTASKTTIATAGTDLTGTTGVDGDFTISVKQGAIQLENRRGVSIGSVRYGFLGSDV